MSIIQAALACVVFPMFHFRQGRQVLVQKKKSSQSETSYSSVRSAASAILYHVVRSRYDAQKLLNGNIS